MNKIYGPQWNSNTRPASSRHTTIDSKTTNRSDPLRLWYDDGSPHLAIVILFQHDAELIQTDRLNQIAAG